MILLKKKILFVWLHFLQMSQAFQQTQLRTEIIFVLLINDIGDDNN